MSVGRIRRVAPALELFLLAPFVGEFLLGNLTIGELGIVLAPLWSWSRRVGTNGSA